MNDDQNELILIDAKVNDGKALSLLLIGMMLLSSEEEHVGTSEKFLVLAGKIGNGFCVTKTIDLQLNHKC